MNCKPSDLAIVVRGFHGFTNAGKIVKVIDLAFPNHTQLWVVWNIELSRPIKVSRYTRDLWRLEGMNLTTRCHCADDWLRPLPGETASDEIEEQAAEPIEQMEAA